jgi:endonuclease/exonuclease/phosphatase family metal-dependent hydrolase
MLEATKADVYGFQELWAARAIRDAFAVAKMLDDYEFIARDAPGVGKPQVAMAAKKGIIDFTGREPDDDAWWIEDFPEELVLRKRRTIEQVKVDIDSFSRPVLDVTAKPLRPADAPAMRVFVAHLKSKRPVKLDREEFLRDEVKAHSAAIGAALASVRRTAEAAALRVMLNKAMEGNTMPHVVIGDMNNGSLSVSTSILTGDPRYKVIDTSRDVTGRRADLGLYSVEQLQQYRSQRHTMYTHIFENKLETLDHILVSEEFYDHSVNRIWSFAETRSWNDHLHLSHKRNRENPPRVWPTDHGVVETVFEYNPFEQD